MSDYWVDDLHEETHLNTQFFYSYDRPENNHYLKPADWLAAIITRQMDLKHVLDEAIKYSADNPEFLKQLARIENDLNRYTKGEK
jgi:hypothetical protein